MHAYRFRALSNIDDLVLHEEPTPQPQRGEVLVKIHAVSLNYRDLSLVLGNYVWPAKPGLVPCSDAAGEVVAVGDGVLRFKVGDRVISTFHSRWFGGRPPATAAKESYGSAIDGWLAEYKVVSQEALVALPSAVGFTQGSTLPCAATTAWNALCGVRPVRAGRTVLTLGTGGVSVFAVQLAKALGASVVATTSSAAKAERLRELGASYVVNYHDVPLWGQHVKTVVTGGVGVDCVVEVGGAGTMNESLHAVRRGGEVVLIGFLTDANPGIDYFHLKRSGATVRPIGVGDRTMLEEVVDIVAGTRLEPVVDRVFPFGDARAAFAHMKAARHIGKIVINVAS